MISDKFPKLVLTAIPELDIIKQEIANGYGRSHFVVLGKMNGFVHLRGGGVLSINVIKFQNSRREKDEK